MINNVEFNLKILSYDQTRFSYGAFMKIIINILLLILFFIITCKAESDTLVIKQKNNKIEKIALSQIKKIKFESLSNVEDEITNRFSYLKIKDNYPNPFAEQTSIEFEISSAGTVVLFIYDNKGIIKRRIVCENCNKGINIINWNCTDDNGNYLQNGIYYYEIHYGKFIQTKKMLIIK